MALIGTCFKGTTPAFGRRPSLCQLSAVRHLSTSARRYTGSCVSLSPFPETNMRSGFASGRRASSRRRNRSNTQSADVFRDCSVSPSSLLSFFSGCWGTRSDDSSTSSTAVRILSFLTYPLIAVLNQSYSSYLFTLPRALRIAIFSTGTRKPLVLPGHIRRFKYLVVTSLAVPSGEYATT